MIGARPWRAARGRSAARARRWPRAASARFLAFLGWRAWAARVRSRRMTPRIWPRLMPTMRLRHARLLARIRSRSVGVSVSVPRWVFASHRTVWTSRSRPGIREVHGPRVFVLERGGALLASGRAGAVSPRLALRRPPTAAPGAPQQWRMLTPCERHERRPFDASRTLMRRQQEDRPSARSAAHRRRERDVEQLRGTLVSQRERIERRSTRVEELKTEQRVLVLRRMSSATREEAPRAHSVVHHPDHERRAYSVAVPTAAETVTLPAAMNLERLTDQVVERIDHRMRAWRERLGRH